MFGYLKKQLNGLEKVLVSPTKPYTAILGGASEHQITIIEIC